MDTETDAWRLLLDGRVSAGGPVRQMRRVAGEVASVPKSPALSAVDGVGPTAPPPLSVQSPSSPSLSAQLPPPDPPLEQNCAISHEPNCAESPEDFHALPYDELHQLCRRRGHAKEDSKAALKTRPSTMVLSGHKRAHDTSGEMSDAAVKRKCVERLHSAFAMYTGVAKEHANRGIRVKERPGALRLAHSWRERTQRSPLGRLINKANHWAAAEHAALGKVAKERELAGWKEFGDSTTGNEGVPSVASADFRLALDRNMLDGRATVEARLAAKASQDPDS